MSEEEKIKSDHFKTIEDLIKHCKLWINTDDWEGYCRWFSFGSMEDLINLIEKQQKEIEMLKNKIKGV